MDYSTLSDAELDHRIAMARLNPMAADPRDVESMQAERAARRAPKPAPVPDNVENDLDAAAAPLTPDPAVKPRVIVPPKPAPKDAYRQSLIEAGWDPDEVDSIMESEGGLDHAYAIPVSPDNERQDAQDWHAREARHAAREGYWRDVYGHNYAGTGLENEPRTASVEGYDVPLALDSVGNPISAPGGGYYFPLGALKAAKEAAADAAWRATQRKRVDDEIAKYGHYTIRDTAEIGTGPGMLTQEQYDNRMARKRAEENQRAQIQRMRQVQIDNKDRPLTPYEQQQKDRRNLVAQRAKLAGGSQNLNSGNNAMFTALAMLEGVDPNKMDAQQRALMQNLPIDPMRAQIEARQLDMAGRMAQNAVTAFLTNNPGATAEQRRIADLQAEGAQAQQAAGITAAADTLVDEYADDRGWLNLPTRLVGGGAEGWDNTLLTVEEEEKAVRRLMAQYPHLSYEQARQHVEAAASNKTRQPRAAAQ